MLRNKNRNVVHISLTLILILSSLQLLPFETGVKTVSAGSSWTQTTETDFNTGTLNNVTVTPEGNIELTLQSEHIVDNFVNEANISFKDNIAIVTSSAQAVLMVINKTFGGSDDDYGYCVRQTSDGGYIISGKTFSFGNPDAWLIKADAAGNLEWHQTYGGVDTETAWSVIETNDGGFALIGKTSTNTAGLSDLWFIKTDSQGVEQWDKKYGGAFHESGWEIKQTSDNGYIIAGRAEVLSTSNIDAWLIKTDSSGNKQWDKVFGGPDMDVFYSVGLTSDNGYILFGITESFSPGSNYRDAWLLKTDSSGNEQWNKTYGESGEDLCERGFIASDGGYILVGRTDSYDVGSDDSWVIKTDSAGNELWNKTYGGTQPEYFIAGQQTSDNGFVFFGTTESYSPGTNWRDFWLVRTDPAGVELWNKTYGGGQTDYGYYVSLTSDGGYVFTGITESYGSANYDPWLVKTDAYGNINSAGDLVSVNLLEGRTLYSIDNFVCNVTIPSGSSIKIRFSQDNSTWYNSSGILSEWDILYDGLNSFDLSALNWNTPYIYYHMKFESDIGQVPALNNINLSYSHYHSSGTYTSDPFDGTTDSSWKILTWAADTTTETTIELQIRTAATATVLANTDFTGPDGTVGSYYTSSPANIWAGHYSDQWYQYRIYFNTTNTKFTPILQEVIVDYNCLPDLPTLTAPADNIWINDNTPIFNWTFNDLDGTQAGAQIQIDDDNKFISVDYDCTIQSIPGQSWQFPEGTSYTTISDGIWYWILRTQDDDGDWSSYSEYWILKVDAIAPESFTPVADPVGWTSNDQPEITFSTTDATSGIDHYEIQVDSYGLYTQTSPHTLPTQTDGVHTVTVRAYDLAGNYRTEKIDVYIDTEQPNDFTPTADPSGWSANDQPVISYSTTDETSGIDRYEVKVDNNAFSEQTSPYTLPPQPDGEHTVIIRAYDLAGNYRDKSIDVYVDTKPPHAFTPNADPSEWSSDTQPEISFSTTDTTSGIDHYEVRIDEGAFYEQVSPYELPAQTDGKHTVTVRAYDLAGNYRDEGVEVYIDNSPPSIEHEPVTDTQPNTEITITANITDLHCGVGNVKLHFKKQNEVTYTTIEMNGRGSTYTATIPAEEVTEDLEYYIEASDKSDPINIKYFGADGEVEARPSYTNDIDISVDTNGEKNGNGGDPEGEEPDGKSDANDSIFLLAGIIIVIIVIVIIILWFLFLRNKKQPPESLAPPPQPQEQAVQQQQPPQELPQAPALAQPVLPQAQSPQLQDFQTQMQPKAELVKKDQILLYPIGRGNCNLLVSDMIAQGHFPLICAELFNKCRAHHIIRYAFSF